MAGRADELVPWRPGDASGALYREANHWINQAHASGLRFSDGRVSYSALIHIRNAVRISDAAIYRMIMKESEQE